MKFLSHSDSLVIIFIKRYNLTLIRIEFLDLLLDGVVGTESGNNLNALLVSLVQIRGDLRLLVTICTLEFVLRVISILRVLSLRLLPLFKRKVSKAHINSIILKVFL